MTRHETYDERRQQILQGALKTFSEKGYFGSSNKDIAQTAGINSTALIYHYFENKQALFEAVIEEFMPPLQLIADPEALLQLPVEKTLRQIAIAMVDILSEPTTNALFCLMLSEALHSSEVSHLVFRGGSQKILSVMYAYFDRLMSEGILRQVDVGAALRCFVGPIAAYMLNDRMLRMPDEKSPARDVMIDTHISIFLKGLDYRKD